MTTTKTVTKMIDRAKVTKVYSGKPGCACGCRGTYSYTSDQIATGNVADWQAPNGANDKTVDRIVRMFNKLIANGDIRVYTYDNYPNFVVFDKSASRTYAVYFN